MKRKKYSTYDPADIASVLEEYIHGDPKPSRADLVRKYPWIKTTGTLKQWQKRGKNICLFQFKYLSPSKTVKAQSISTKRIFQK